MGREPGVEMPMRRLSILLLALVLIHYASGTPDEAVGRVVSIISGDSFGIEIHISDPRTTSTDSVKLADIESPSTVTPEGKAARKFLDSLLKNKTVYLDIDDNSSAGRNQWNQLMCVVYLTDSEDRPVWPPVNRILVDSGFAALKDDKSNEFNSTEWWQKPVAPKSIKSSLKKNLGDEMSPTISGISDKYLIQNPSSNSANAPITSNNSTSILLKDPNSGKIRIGYRA